MISELPASLPASTETSDERRGRMVKEAHKRFDAKHAGYQREWRRRWAPAHREQIRKSEKRYRQKHRGKIRERKQRYRSREEVKLKSAEYQKHWRSRHPSYRQERYRKEVAKREAEEKRFCGKYRDEINAFFWIIFEIHKEELAAILEKKHKKAKERYKKYDSEHREKRLAAAKLYQKNHPGNAAIKAKKWRYKNRSKVITYNVLYAITHRMERARYRYHYYHDNHEREIALVRIWQSQNRNRVKMTQARFRATKQQFEMIASLRKVRTKFAHENTNKVSH